MSGIELRDGTLIVSREPNRLDELAIEFSAILDRFRIDHAYVAGYVSILAGRARSTENVDIFIEDIDGETAAALAETLKDEGFWGTAMPLSSMYEMLSNGDNIWVALDDQVTPYLKGKSHAMSSIARPSRTRSLLASVERPFQSVRWNSRSPTNSTSVPRQTSKTQSTSTRSSRKT